ncbi:MAG: histone deacetylase family protein [Gammaproteobacteria bacterium]
MPTGFCHDQRFLAHDTGPGHPERPERFSTPLRHINGLAWRDKLLDIDTKRAEPEWIRSVHDSDYIARAKAACKAGHSHLDSMDVAISPRSFEIASLAAGAGISIADRIMNGTVDNGFALVRPPGHHAEHDTALGFCLFNNIAILANYLKQAHALDKIAIVDWDVHHGNGTQHTFDSDPSVLYVSTHQFPYYPGTGAASETGVGIGKGSVVNCPMPAGASDALYERAFREKILPALEKFKPDAVLISAGFDAHHSDPLAEISLTTEFFGWMTLRLMEIADKHAEGRIISLLEGGYNLNTLGACIEAHLAMLMNLAAESA